MPSLLLPPLFFFFFSFLSANPRFTNSRDEFERERGERTRESSITTRFNFNCPQLYAKLEYARPSRDSFFFFYFRASSKFYFFRNDYRANRRQAKASSIDKIRRERERRRMSRRRGREDQAPDLAIIWNILVPGVCPHLVDRHYKSAKRRHSFEDISQRPGNVVRDNTPDIADPSVRCRAFSSCTPRTKKSLTKGLYKSGKVVGIGNDLSNGHSSPPPSFSFPRS